MAYNENEDTFNQTDLNKIIAQVDGIPLPTEVKKNLWKAFGQLVYGVIDIPLAWLEKFPASIRNKTNSSLQMEELSLQIAKEELKKDNEFISRTKAYHFNKLKNRQKIRENIFNHSLADIENSNLKTVDNKKEIKNDWLIEFANRAELKSDEGFQIVLSKMLTGEIKRPGTFSLQTLHILSLMDSEIAQIFQIASNLSVYFFNEKTDRSYLFFEHLDGISPISLQDYELSAESITKISELGLIHQREVTLRTRFYNYDKVNEENNTYKVRIGEHLYHFIKTKNSENKETYFKVIQFTKAGSELLSLFKPISNLEFEQELINYFIKKTGSILK